MQMHARSAHNEHEWAKKKLPRLTGTWYKVSQLVVTRGVARIFKKGFYYCSRAQNFSATPICGHTLYLTVAVSIKEGNQFQDDFSTDIQGKTQEDEIG